MSGSAKNMAESAGRTGVSTKRGDRRLAGDGQRADRGECREELAASIREIGGQVAIHDDRRPRRRCGRETPPTIEALNTQVNQIGWSRI